MQQLFMTYMLPSAISLIALYGIFFFFLKNETFFAWNRIFLLGAILFSLALPFIKIPVHWSTEVVKTYFMPSAGDTPNNVNTISPIIIRASADGTTQVSVFYYIYIAGTSIVLLRLVLGLGRILYLRFKNGISHYHEHKVIRMHNRLSHFSFFGYIFLNMNLLSGEEETLQVLLHEKEHQHQWHCLDLILLELLILLQWFNPVVWFYNHSLKSIHEYQADQAVISSGCSRADYLNLIFKQVSGIQMLVSTNQFNYLSIKKRIIMISKKKSSAWAKNKILFFVPVTVALLFVFAVKPVDSIASSNHSKQEVLQQKEKNNVSLPESNAPIDEKPAIEAHVNDTLALKKNEMHQQIASLNSKTSFTEITVIGPNGEFFNVLVEGDSMPTYNGGQEALYKFIGENLKYPEDAKKNKVEGTVIVEFVVEKDGSLSNTKIQKSLNKSCDEEVLRVFKLMPKWNPAIQKGKVVSAHMRLPVMFKLQ